MPGPMCTKLEQQELLFDRMVERCGVDVGRLARLDDGQGYAQARTRCLLCPAPSLCAFWLDAAPSNSEPVFCPNLDLFQQCIPQAMRDARKPSGGA